MKKIYILTAVLALLTLSLNAQQLKVDQFGNVAQPKAQAGKVNAPNRVTTTVVNNDFSDASWWTIYDVNGDNSTWTITSGYGRYSWNSSNAANDWLVSSAIALEAGKTYTFSLDAWRQSTNYEERLEVMLLTDNSQTALSGGSTIITERAVSSTSSSTPDNLSNTFTVQTTGNYYIGIHATSARDRYYLYVDNLLITFEYTDPTIVVSPGTLTINDSGTNNTFTVEGSNLGSDNVGVTVPQGSAFSTTTTDQTWGFVNNNGSVSGTVTVTYGGRALLATETVTAANNLTSATVTVNYVPNLYIYSDNGVSPWDFSANPAIAMSNQGNGIYTATLASIPDNSHILFGRASGLTYNWEGDYNRLFFGASTDGGDWGYGDNTTGYLDTDPTNDSPVKYHPIYFPEGGTYSITIDVNANTFTINKLVMPPPENVVATANSENQSATVTWNAPSNLPTTTYTEGFEDQTIFVPFSAGGVTATVHTGAFGEWTLYDATNGSTVYGSTELDFANENQPHAWFVFNPSGVTPAEGYENTASPHPANNGEQYLESICPTSSSTAAGLSDHWLISPELSGNAQTITFYESELTTNYGAETYEIWVSSTDNTAPSSFTKLGDTHSVSVSTWAAQSIELPAGTKYFAIRHTSNDIFGLLIDDVTYEVSINPVSYNVYLDGTLVGNVDAADALTYTFNNVSVGDHECAVSAVYEGGIESALVPAQFNIVGKTAAPTISVTPGETAYTITATADDPTATVTLTVDGEVHTGTGSVSVTIDRGTADQTVAVSATAQEDGLLVSDPASQNVTVPMLPVTPTPVITYETNNATVVITATGEGTVYLEVDGQIVSGEGTVSITIMRSIEDRTVTATATAVAPNHQPSAQDIDDIPVPALAGNPAVAQEGLLRMHLLVVDQLKANIPDNNGHPDRYGYVLKWEQPANVEDHKESGTVQVNIQKTEAKVNGYYTLSEIDNDTEIGINHDQGLTMDVLTADVSMFLPGENPDILYYQLQGKMGDAPELNKDYLTQLQYMKNVQKYEEMLTTSPNVTHQYPANETYHYFDDSTPIVTGTYNAPNSFITYAPSVSTWGIQRRYFESDGENNTYGAPIWKTGVGDVVLNSATAEKQQGWNTTWQDGNDNCRLYMLDNIEAWGYLPTAVSNVEYEPYMFRVFVESKNGKLRKFKYDTVTGEDGKTNEVIAADVTSDEQKQAPLCVWSAYVNLYDDETLEALNTACSNTFTEGNDGTYDYLQFNKDKVDRTAGYDEQGNPLGEWDQDETNAIFGVVDDLKTIVENGQEVIDPDDLTIFVRFYYVVKGLSQGWTPWNPGRAAGDAPAGYGSESPGFSPGPATAVNEMHYVGQIVSQTYYNVQGMVSDKPFEGVNIVVTRYSNGTTSVSKVVR